MDAKICPKGKVFVKDKCIKGIEWGFDLTHFGSAEKFKALLKRHNLKTYKKETHTSPLRIYYSYLWESPTLRLITGNNPLTGEYTVPQGRRKEKGYASYIGLQGTEAGVVKIANDIRKSATWSEAESPNQRQFI